MQARRDLPARSKHLLTAVCLTALWVGIAPGRGGAPDRWDRLLDRYSVAQVMLKSDLIIMGSLDGSSRLVDDAHVSRVRIQRMLASIWDPTQLATCVDSSLEGGPWVYLVEPLVSTDLKHFSPVLIPENQFLLALAKTNCPYGAFEATSPARPLVRTLKVNTNATYVLVGGYRGAFLLTDPSGWQKRVNIPVRPWPWQQELMQATYGTTNVNLLVSSVQELIGHMAWPSGRTESNVPARPSTNRITTVTLREFPLGLFTNRFKSTELNNR